jgi:hypothetical protein
MYTVFFTFYSDNLSILEIKCWGEYMDVKQMEVIGRALRKFNRPSWFLAQWFSLCHHAQTNSGAYQASHPMGIGGSFPGR